jgi:hypothetical protein
MSTVKVAPVALVESRILIVRAQKVLLDSDLAALYEVETGALNRAVRRNIARFPEDFMFQLTSEELGSLICQFGISKPLDENRGGRRFLPYAFTRTGDSYAFRRAHEQAGCGGKRRHHADLRSFATVTSHP